MWDLVGNPEDRFSHNEAHLDQLANLHFVSALVLLAEGATKHRMEILHLYIIVLSFALNVYSLESRH